MKNHRRPLQSNAMKSSTVMPAALMKLRRVPTDSSRCCGTERFTRMPGLVSTKWLPTCPTRTQPALSKALTASLPDILASLPTGLNRHDHWLPIRLLLDGGNGFLILRP
jgi:hypothetical protein